MHRLHGDALGSLDTEYAILCPLERASYETNIARCDIIAIPATVTSRCSAHSSLRLHQSTDDDAYHDRGACMAQLTVCKRWENRFEPECACSLLSISPAAHYITYIVGISRARRYTKQKEIAASLREARMPQLLSHIVRSASPSK